MSLKNQNLRHRPSKVIVYLFVIIDIDLMFLIIYSTSFVDNSDKIDEMGIGNCLEEELD